MKKIRGLGLVAALMVATAACGGGTSVGGENDLDYTPPPSTKEAKPKKSKTPKPTPTPTETKTQAPPSGPKADTVQVKATDGYQYDPTDFQARVGDFIVFTNSHEFSDHSFTVEGQEKKMDSGEVKPGEKAKLTVDLAPGSYAFYCTVVTFMQGALEVYG